MLYETEKDWRAADQKRVLIYGMSGLGKTYISNTLRDSGQWFHYSIDYRIGTRYMGEVIVDNAKEHAMQVPFLRDLLMSDSIYIGSNISVNNLSPVSTYLGKPGDPAMGGTPIEEYTKRQLEFRRAEIFALNDTGYFIERAKRLYQYPNFICDTGGSICEWVDGNDPNDPILQELSQHCLLVWLKGDTAHIQELVRRFKKDPKPMAYRPEFLEESWAEYLRINNILPNKVDPNDFVSWTYERAMQARQPRYEAMAKWGITIPADQLGAVSTSQEFDQLVGQTLAARP